MYMYMEVLSLFLSCQVKQWKTPSMEGSGGGRLENHADPLPKNIVLFCFVMQTLFSRFIVTFFKVVLAPRVGSPSQIRPPPKCSFYFCAVFFSSKYYQPPELVSPTRFAP